MSSGDDDISGLRMERNAALVALEGALRQSSGLSRELRIASQEIDRLEDRLADARARVQELETELERGRGERDTANLHKPH